jgi:ferrous iron transport protein B
MLRETWERTRDILTIVTPLLVGGSVVLALLAHVGADRTSMRCSPRSLVVARLPVVPRRPHPVRSAAQGAFFVDDLPGARHLRGGSLPDQVQITTFLLFLTFYVPCISTFAVMAKTIGRRAAMFSVSLSVAVALLVSGLARFGLGGVRLFLA